MRRRAPTILVIAAAATLALAPGARGAADGNNPGFAEKDRVISLAPTIAQHTVDPGERQTFELTVHNTTSKPFRFTLAFQDLQAHPDERRDKRLVASGTAERGAGAWLSTEQPRFELSAGEKRRIPVTAAIPSDIAPGGYFAAAVVAATNASAEAGIRITTELTTLVLLTVDGGELRRGLDVSVRPASRIDLDVPTEFTVRVRNTGNVHEIVALTAQADPLIGSGIAEEIPGFVVFPGRTREFPIRQDVRNAPNLFRPTVRWKTAGDDARFGTRTESAEGPLFLLVPWWTLVVLVLAVGTIVARLRWRSGDNEDDDEWGAERLDED